MLGYIVCFLAFIASFSVSSADLTLVDGTVYTHAELKKCSAGFVYILHEKGEAKIALENIPGNFIAALNARQRNALRNGADIKLANGAVYKNCTVKKMGRNLLTVKHAQGILDIAFTDLPEYYRATFNRSQLLKISGDTSAAVGKNVNVIGKTAAGQTVYAGPRGGRYYINDRGRRVYLKKDVEIKPVDGINTTAVQP